MLKNSATLGVITANAENKTTVENLLATLLERMYDLGYADAYSDCLYDSNGV